MSAGTATRRALVTGATGFIGSHLARALVADGVDVHLVVRVGAHLDRVPDLVAACTVHVDDGTHDAMAALVESSRPDVTYHLATHFVAEHRPDDVAPMVAANVAFPARLVDALVRAQGTPVLVNAGTAWQHVDGEVFRPKNLYAATKQAFEDVACAWCERGALRMVTANVYDSYGPDDHRGKLVDALVRAAREGTHLDLTSGRQVMDLVHVRDLVAAFRRAAEVARDVEPGAPPTWWSLSSGWPCTVREVVETMGEVAGRPLDVTWGARPDRPGDPYAPWSAGPPLPGWSAVTTLATGFRELVTH